MESDYALALSLQSEFDRENADVQPSADNENFNDEMSDLDLAYRLQAEYAAEVDDESEDCIITADNTRPKDKKVPNSEAADWALALKLQNEWRNESGKTVVWTPEKKSQNKQSNLEAADLSLAKKLQDEWSHEAKRNQDGMPQQNAQNLGKSGSIVDASWELVDPCPDIHALFLEFDASYFWGRLAGVEVRWSPRMTLCAGICVYEGRGGLCSVRLSHPLLKLRPRKDLVETLLHEMIHAYLFVTQNNKDHDGHGPEFHKHMYRINQLTGTKITVYHSFHQEVALYKQHWWRCSGVCRDRKPFYGWVKRAMNRPPQPRDPWWAEHQQTCGGTFVKVKSPEPTEKPGAVKRKAKDSTKEKDGLKAVSGMNNKRPLFSSQVSTTANKGKANVNSLSGMKDIRTLFPPQAKVVKSDDTSSKTVENLPGSFFPGKGYVLGRGSK